jgi:cell division initiation protein
MIDLTPLDVRKKKGDFRRGMRGYESPQVDDFLELVAERLDAVVRENVAMKERLKALEAQLAAFQQREHALTDALVTAQTMREEIRSRSTREGDQVRRQAEEDAARIRAEAERTRAIEEGSLEAVRERHLEFLSGYRAFLEHELHDLTTQGKALGQKLGVSVSPPPTAPPTSPVAPPWAQSGPVSPPRAQSGGAVVAPASISPNGAPSPAVKPVPAADGWSPTDEVFGPRSPSPPRQATPESFETDPEIAPPALRKPTAVEDDLDARIGSMLSEWEPAPEEELVLEDEADGIVDFLLSDDDVEENDDNLFGDDADAGLVAGTPMNAMDALADEDDGFVLSESDILPEAVATTEGEVDVVERDGLAGFDPFADEEPAFTIGPIPKRPDVEPAQAADDAAFMDDLDEAIKASTEPPDAARGAPAFDPFDEHRAASSVESDDDVSAAFGDESGPIDALLEGADFSGPAMTRPKPEPTGNFTASFGLTLRPTLGSDGAGTEEEEDGVLRSESDARDFYSVPRTVE